MSGDPVREETRSLAAELAAPPTRPTLSPPPPRVAAPASTPVAPAPLEDRPEGGSTGPSAGDPADQVSALRRRRRPQRAEGVEAGALAPAAPMTVTLTRPASVLLEDARADGTTVREALLGAVRGTVDELRRRHPPVPDSSGPIPMLRVRRRRKLDHYGVKVPVRMYRPEKEALDALADELGISVSALVTEALEVRYGSP